MYLIGRGYNISYHAWRIKEAEEPAERFGVTYS